MDVTHGQAAHEALRKWLETERISYSELARRCSSERNKFIAKQITRVVVDGQSPPPQLAGALADVTGIPAVSWREEVTPKSDRQPVVPRQLGTTLEELRATVQDLDTALRSSGLTPSHQAQLLGRRTTALVAISRLELDGALEQHPDFEQFRADILGAIKDAFGDLCTSERMRALAESMRRRGKAKRMEAAA